jgi:VIT1/CCC1 family predicted Fe2+/Mn2+ transporter
VFKNYKKQNRTKTIGWLRAAVLGANDGILSTASLIVGVAASHAPRETVLVAGVAGLVAGAMSMAAGEYVSVSSQADTEKAELARESKQLDQHDKSEHKELASIYVSRGLDPVLAKQVAKQLMDHDALAAHARDELGLSVNLKPRPVQAALTSAVTFSVGAAMPLFTVFVSSEKILVPIVFGASLIFLALLGILAACVGGAPIVRPAIRVMFWGALAMGLTAAVGALFGTVR